MKRLISPNEFVDNYKPITKEDREELKWHIECDVPLFIDEWNRVYNEAGTYIADVKETKEESKMKNTALKVEQYLNIRKDMRATAMTEWHEALNNCLNQELDVQRLRETINRRDYRDIDKLKKAVQELDNLLGRLGSKADWLRVTEEAVQEAEEMLEKEGN